MSAPREIKPAAWLVNWGNAEGRRRLCAEHRAEYQREADVWEEPWKGPAASCEACEAEHFLDVLRPEPPGLPYARRKLADRLSGFHGRQYGINTEKLDSGSVRELERLLRDLEDEVARAKRMGRNQPWRFH